MKSQFSNRQFRKLVRVLHIAVGVSLILVVYSPLGKSPTFVTFNQFVAVPLVSLSGLALWQQPKLTAWLKGRK